MTMAFRRASRLANGRSRTTSGRRGITRENDPAVSTVELRVANRPEARQRRLVAPKHRDALIARLPDILDHFVSALLRDAVDIEIGEADPPACGRTVLHR